jgi:urocanate hydratase
MSGAQGKAVEIAGGVCIIAEVDRSRITTRHEQGWVSEVSPIRRPRRLHWPTTPVPRKTTTCRRLLHGNIVDLLEYAVNRNVPIDLLSDQTSCHVVYDGGYCPQGMTFAERTRMLKEDRHAVSPPWWIDR